MTSLSALVPYLGLRVQGSWGSRGGMNDCLLSGGKQKNVCLCVHVFKREKQEAKIDWMTEGKRRSQRDGDRWKYKHKQEIHTGRQNEKQNAAL